MDVQRYFNDLQSRLNQRPLLSSALIGSTGLCLAWAIQDYRDFKRLGAGGVPYNLFGWLIVTLLLRPLSLRKKDTTSTDDYEFGRDAVSQEIRKLPTRSGERAEVGGIVPQRQLSQNAPEGMRKPLQDLFLKDIVEQNPDLVETKLSHYERHNPALYVHPTILTLASASAPEAAHVSQGEIGHVHPDLSLHLYFSEADARTIMEKGWGERHRLARKTPWYYPGQKFIFGLAPTYVLVYGPRDEAEFEVVKTVLKASVKFMTGGTEVKL